MNVACATSAMSGYYHKYFRDMKVIGHESNVGKVDLLILTGGSDISPERYREAPNGSTGIDSERDEREFNILREVLAKNPDAKVLGVCRGMQLLNVFFGGSLYQDIDSVGKLHHGVHEIDWKLDEHPLRWLEKVNSLHHQAVRAIGWDNGDAYILAEEPRTSIPEIMVWGRNTLGVQFHPELFSDEPGSKFFSVIEKWVKGEVSMFERVDEEDSDEDWEEDEDSEEDDGEEEVFNLEGEPWDTSPQPVRDANTGRLQDGINRITGTWTITERTVGSTPITINPEAWLPFARNIRPVEEDDTNV
jgi:putative glutamine amidotransferase